MADRIMAALEYLDAHTSLVLQKQKQRSLGDIDAKYDVVDPSQLQMNPVTESRISLTGTSRTNLSKEKTIEQILDEDREKLLRSPQRNKSASLQKSSPYSRPQTSLSSKSMGVASESSRRSLRPHSQAASSVASRTSMKKLTFTPPGVHVGPTDARDEVMEEIVSKPLTHSPAKTRGSPAKSRPAFSAPVLGQHGKVSVGCRSLTSLHRSKTFHVGSRRSESLKKKYEAKPGPFTTVKVSGSDMWVVADSTPTSYFNGDLSAYSVPSGGRITKTSSWEETANSVPQEEKKLPPRFERQLGAPPQFGASQQWYTFTGKNPAKQRPILTAFADESSESNYYAIESRVSQKVTSQLEGSPGIRIGINGEVVSKSMKVTKKKAEEAGKDEDSCDAASFRDDDRHVRKNGHQDEELESVKSGSQDRTAEDSDHDQDELADKQEESNVYLEEEENRQYSLLRYLGVARGENPYVTESASETTSSGDVASLLNNLYKNKKPQNGPQIKYNENDEAVWKILENATPTLWVNKEKWRKMQEEMAKRKAKQFITNSEDEHGPLSWKEQLHHTEQRVIEPRNLEKENGDEGRNSTTPVVFHKLVDYNKLPQNFVHLTNNGYRPHSSITAVDRDLNVTPPSKGYQFTVSMSPKTSRFTERNIEESATDGRFQPRPFTSQSHLRMKQNNDLILQHGVDLADIIKVSSDSGLLKAENAVKLTQMEGSKQDDISEEELEAVRQEAAYKMKMTGVTINRSESFIHRNNKKQMNQNSATSENNTPKENHYERRSASEKTVTLNSLPIKAGGLLATVDIRPSKPKSSMPVLAFNMSEMEEDYVVNGPNPTSPTEQRPNATIQAAFTPPNSIINPLRNGHDAPLNTPKTPTAHTYEPKDAQGSSCPKSNLFSPSSNGTRMYSDPASGRTRHTNRISKSASFGSRSPASSPRNNVTQLGQNIPKQTSNRTSEGFMSSPLTGKLLHKHTGKLANGMSKSAKPTSLSSVIPHGHSYAELIANSGFIQISHPIQIQSSQRLSSSGGSMGTGVVSGNKIYDSYMRELSSRSVGNTNAGEFEAGKTAAIFGKGLGGTSGKVLPDHLRHFRPRTTMNMMKVKGGYPNFSVHSGLRSGLTMSSEQLRQPHQFHPESYGFGSSTLGLQGDPVRLNLDKNIHVIYRDLGIPKKSSRSAVSVSRQLSTASSVEKNSTSQSDRRDVRSVGRRSDATRSHPHSAKSSRGSVVMSASDHVVNVPTAGAEETISKETRNEFAIKLKGAGDMNGQREPASHDIVSNDAAPGNGADVNEVFSADREQINSLALRKSSAKSRTSSKSGSGVVDFGTQWSPHEPSSFIKDGGRDKKELREHEEVLSDEASEKKRSDDETDLANAPREIEKNSETEVVIFTADHVTDNKAEHESIREGKNEKIPATKGVDGAETEENLEHKETVERTAKDEVEISIESSGTKQDVAESPAKIVPRPRLSNKEIRNIEAGNNTSASNGAVDEEVEEFGGKRSASDSHLHLAEKESADQADVRPSLDDEEGGVRGVTKVTVNIAASNGAVTQQSSSEK